MIDNLFGSKTRYKLLQLFLNNPNRSFYVREITRKIGEQINSVRRELSNLLSIGIIISDSSNNRLYYEVNQKFDKYKELVSLFSRGGGKKVATDKGKTKAEPVAPAKDDAKLPANREKVLGNVSLVVLCGIFTRDQRAPADVLIVGNVTPAGVKAYVEHLESTIDGEVRYLVLSDEEFAYRQRIKDRLTSTILGSKLVVKVDKNNTLKNAN